MTFEYSSPTKKDVHVHLHPRGRRLYLRQNIELVDVRFCDVPGVQQHFTIPVSEFLDAALSDGLMFDGSSVRGFTAIHESDMKLIPDISSAFVDPFRDRKPWS